jgi:hypothetical protein
MPAVRVYLGPNDSRQPITTPAKALGAALLPATFVTETATSFTQATAFGPNLRLLADRDYFSEAHFNTTDHLKVAYASGETAQGYVLEVGQRYNAAAAAATYTFGQALTVGANGRLAAATTGNIVVGFAREAGAKAAGDMLAFEVANHYAQA